MIKVSLLMLAPIAFALYIYVGEYVFPDASCVPKNMEKIVSDYNMKFSQTHDPYQLATWLFFKVISLHPFKDGNGRLCRLLWCYSLMHDGLPFPLTYSSGHKKAYKHYVYAIERSQTSKDHPCLTTLTVISICNAWKYFHDSVASIDKNSVSWFIICLHNFLACSKSEL